MNVYLRGFSGRLSAGDAELLPVSVCKSKPVPIRPYKKVTRPQVELRGLVDQRF